MTPALGDEEARAISELARSIARDRETARRLSMTFASRLLDLCLVEVAMVWQGRDELASAHGGAAGDPLSALVETKLRLVAAEGGAGAPAPCRR